MDKDALFILYSFRRCPYALRARLAMLASGQNCILREIDLQNKAPLFLKTSPKGTVPVLQLTDGTIIDESLDIMAYLFRQYAPQYVAYKQDKDKPFAKNLMARLGQDFIPSLNRYKYTNHYPDANKQEAQAGCLGFLETLDTQLAGKEWLFGTAHMIDFAILPFVRQFRIADERWFDDVMRLPHLKGWLVRFLSHPYFEKAMRKYDVWQEGDAPVQFP